ncbi:hypothetical protein [Rhodanobacter glycinis]|uniref:hypothetical protein n=1 Tax=Rhodanobacter glycinis TaxID=582702 RepID=UPI00112B4F4A|nr:hypothetical protein [Rhodanobacter glycinis]
MYAITTNAGGTTGWRAIGSAEDLVAGEVIADAPPEPTLADAAVVLIADVQAWLDATASQNGYNSLASCISYKDSAIAQWAADATAAIAWRDAVWQAAFQWQQAASANPPATFPTSAEVIAQLPQPEAFGWIVHQPGATV